MSEDKLKQRLADFMSKLSIEPSKKDVDNAVKGIFNDKKKAAKDNDDKPKRKLSAWNIFYKEQSAILKLSEEKKDKEDRMSAKEKMTYIASLWKSKCENGGDSAENFQEAVEEPEPEPEIKPDVKGKKYSGKSYDAKKDFKNGPKKGKGE